MAGFEPTYSSIEELLTVFPLPESRKEIVAFLDNDEISFQLGDEYLLGIDPYKLQEDILTHLGFQVEHV